MYVTLMYIYVWLICASVCLFMSIFCSRLITDEVMIVGGGAEPAGHTCSHEILL